MIFAVLVAIWGVVSSQDMSACGDDMVAFCKRESNRYCFMSEETGKAACGNCLSGFVEWRARCISEDKVDILLFLEEYAPQYLEPLSNEQRAELLIKALKFIAQYQDQNPPLPFELGINAFSADTEEELRAHLGFDPVAASGATPPPGVNIRAAPTFQSSTLPEKVDWVEVGAVTSVKDQGRCGCCWAVSTAGVIEGAVAIQHEYLQSLSFQQFISCDDENYGCNGGSLVYALYYSITQTGVATADNYAFTDKDGTTTEQCDTSVSTAVAVQEASYVVDFYDELTFDERLLRMKEAVAKQPVAMVLKSGCQLFSNYRKGILTTDDGCECDDPMCADHAVLMVGYDDTSDPPSWKIKNSWSDGWGEDGYVRIAQTEKGNYGLFGILVHGVVPDLTQNLTASTVSVSEAQESEEETKLPWWAWLLILVAFAIILFGVFSCLSAFVCPRKKGES